MANDLKRDDCCDVLENVDKLMNEPDTISLVQPVDTRWETCLDAIKSALRCKSGIQITAIHPEPDLAINLKHQSSRVLSVLEEKRREESDPIYGVNPITDHEIREMMGNM
ncbi:23556_t:CDS:2 [Gigaspora margarita]|uniref:23556_t:CDS:1 n=1 Tax=Gigaspora margarita TaxID=4874 RepID=A0ABN7U8I9_GIGMA|nr:23556_t:CDS:2 [Gigaspora margarita]